MVSLARATTEPPSAAGNSADVEGYNAKYNEAAQRVWSKGYGAAGYSLFTNVTKLIPGTIGYPVPYPATMDLGANGGCMGVKAMAKRIVDRSKACPNMRFALGGHSQGGSVTTAAILTLPKEVLSKIVAVTMFGTKPCSDIKAQVQNCKSYCNKGDAVSSPSIADTPTQLTE
jgi:surfactin synthase thioesterase subunit